MNDHGKKIQERSEVDMTSSDSRNVMGHCAAQKFYYCLDAICIICITNRPP